MKNLNELPQKFQIQPSDDEEYNFLYIAHGNHVVGVSSPFRVVDEETLDGLGIELLFSVPREEGAALRSPSEEEFHRLTCSGFQHHVIILTSYYRQSRTIHLVYKIVLDRQNLAF